LSLSRREIILAVLVLLAMPVLGLSTMLVLSGGIMSVLTPYPSEVDRLLNACCTAVIRTSSSPIGYVVFELLFLPRTGGPPED
jgi:hypothetical protein